MNHEDLQGIAYGKLPPELTNKTLLIKQQKTANYFVISRKGGF